MKNEQLYQCAKCDAQSSKWTGRCLECGGWGTLKEMAVEDTTDQTTVGHRHPGKPGKPVPFADHSVVEATTTPTKLPSLDLVLGGGLVRGSVTLLAGEPGIGKSTLLAQAAIVAAKDLGRVIYITGEESPSQVRRRLERLSPTLPATLLFLEDTNAATIAATIEVEKPVLMIVDSIQIVRAPEVNGEAGSVAQVKTSAAIITEAAKRSHIPVILVGQVTKDGDIAGPRVLEHLVDTVLFLEGDKDHRYRILRAFKHRFGPTDETALLSMTERGLEPVEDPSSELLRDRAMNASGTAITCLIEGNRPMLLELQALVSPAGYGTPVRRTSGIDTSRLGMLLAVLAKRASIYALDKDVYANAVGGIDARDQSCDLALCAAIASATKDVPLDPKTGLFGEVGLAGELRPVSLPELRIKEFARMGFQTVIVPKGQGKSIGSRDSRREVGMTSGVAIKEAGTLREALGMAVRSTPSAPPS